MIKMGNKANGDRYKQQTLCSQLRWFANCDRYKTADKTNRFLAVFKFREYRKAEKQKKDETLKNSSQNNLLCRDLSNDIVISSSGQVKINNLDSCLNLVSNDFIVF